MIPKIYIHSNPAELTSPRFAAAFLRGLEQEAMGEVAAEIVNDGLQHRDGMWAGFGSPTYWSSLQDAIASGRTWYFGDHGYFGRRDFYRITKNGYQYEGGCTPDFARLRMFHRTALPFKKSGKHILICLHSENFHERVGAPLPQYLNDLQSEIRMRTDRKIIVRTKKTGIPFDAHLRNAWCVVTHSSMCALHALMAGIPAFTTARCSLSSLTLSDMSRIEAPYYPTADQRYTLAARLAANQWTMDEISTGQPWRYLNEKV